MPLVTQMSGGGQITTVAQVLEVAVGAGPQGPFPLAVKKSRFVPQVVGMMVNVPTDTLVCEATVPTRFVWRVTLPLASVTVSTTVTPVRAKVPQFETEPETWKDRLAPSQLVSKAGPQVLATVRQGVLVTTVRQTCETAETVPPQRFVPTAGKETLTRPR